MPSPKNQAASVTTYADHEVITPASDLRRLVSVSTEASEDPIARAEAALAQLSSEFADWMLSECERLEAARRVVVSDGLNAATLPVLFRAAHDIRGGAPTFGYPELAGVADSLCRLLEHTPEPPRIPIALVEQHVDAIRAIIREYARPDLADTARALTRRLRDVTDEFLRRENSFRPDYLEAIFSPSLA